uniref:Uncharacterized protein n=1 Tax=Aegilops tauschii subsp. strangulata TaxID=200361 RepID=A0A453NB37_AEGTS
IGLHVLSEILRYISPTDVIRLNTTTEGKNLPGGAFWLDAHEGDSQVNLVEIHAAQNSPRHLLVKKEARMIRDLRLIAYFRQCLPRDFPIFSSDDLVQGIAAIDPFQLPLSKIQVIDLHSQVFLVIQYMTSWLVLSSVLDQVHLSLCQRNAHPLGAWDLVSSRLLIFQETAFI